MCEDTKQAIIYGSILIAGLITWYIEMAIIIRG